MISRVSWPRLPDGRLLAGYLRLEQFTKVSEPELKQLHGIGPNAIAKLRRALGAKGLSFADGKTRKEQG